MKVRIGVAIGGRQATAVDRLGDVLDHLDRLGFDSIWLPETFLAGTIDPLVGLAFAAARVRWLKLGTHLVAPGRNPYALAKSLAQLDRLSGGRLLLTLVAGLNDADERRAQGVPTGDRTVWFDDQLPRIRTWWAGESVDGLTLDARPLQNPLEVWLGGQAPKALARVGALGDGWLPGGITIEAAIAGRATIDRIAEEHDRSISREHFGINITYSLDPDSSVHDGNTGNTANTGNTVALGRPQLRALLERWIDAGFSKIIVRPLTAPSDWSAELEALADTVLDMQT